MRILLWLIFGVSLVSAEAKPKSTPSVETQPSRQEILDTIRHMQSLARDIQTKLDSATIENEALKVNITTIQTEKVATDAAIVTLQTDINSLRAVNQQLQKQVDTDKTTIAHLLKLLHWWKLYGGLVIASFVAYIVWNCVPLAFIQYKIPATLLAFGLTEAFVWFFL